MADPVFLAPTPMARLRELARKSRCLAAVPFLGKDASKLLPLKSGSVLITRVTKEDVQQGLVSPAEVLAYLKAGVEVHSCTNLHAKVYVFGRRAVIGSANISKTSTQLVEAAIEVTEPRAVAQASAFVEGLRVEPVSPEFAESLLPLYREDRVGGWSESRQGQGGPRSTKTRAIHARIWVMPVTRLDWGEAEQAAADAARSRAERRMHSADYRLDEVAWNHAEWRKLAAGDRVVQRHDRGRGFNFEPPARIVHLQPFGDRGAIVFLERRKRLRLVGSKGLRAALGKHAAHFVRPSTRIHSVSSGEAASEIARLWPSLQE